MCEVLTPFLSLFYRSPTFEQAQKKYWFLALRIGIMQIFRRVFLNFINLFRLQRSTSTA